MAVIPVDRVIKINMRKIKVGGQRENVSFVLSRFLLR